MMGIVFFLWFFIAVLPLWAWLVSRLWKASPRGMRVSFFLIVPAYIWAYRQWNDHEIAPRPALIANLFALMILILVGLKAFAFDIESLFFGRDYAEEKQQVKTTVRTSAEWTRWCRENNDATYDPMLGTCVENGKDEAVARSKSTDLFGRLLRHLDKSGIQGEFDESQAASTSQSQWLAPEIAQATPYYFFPLSMSQPPVTLLLCVSEAACIRYEENARDHGQYNLARNGNLLLSLPSDNAADPRIDALANAFARFKNR